MGYGTGYGIFIVIQWSMTLCFIESQWICRIQYENASHTGVRILPITSVIDALFLLTSDNICISICTKTCFLCFFYNRKSVRYLKKLMIWPYMGYGKFDLYQNQETYSVD